MFQLIGRELYRWDLDRKVKLSVYEAIDEVHVAKHGGDEALIVAPRKEKGMVVADIPNILLQTARKITVYAVKDGATIGSDTFLVKYKEKPSGYVYTETEVKTWTKLEERIGDIEKNSAETIKQAVNDYLKENPLESGTSDAVQYIAQTLTEEQQAQARTNIGAASAKEVSQLSEEIDGLSKGNINISNYGLTAKDRGNGIVEILLTAIASSGVTQSGNVLTIIDGITVTQNGSTLAIA